MQNLIGQSTVRMRNRKNAITMSAKRGGHLLETVLLVLLVTSLLRQQQYWRGSWVKGRFLSEAPLHYLHPAHTFPITGFFVKKILHRHAAHRWKALILLLNVTWR